MKKMNISNLSKKNFSNLSDGEKQISLIARALIKKPNILILDEPVANLDYKSKFFVVDKVNELSKLKTKILCVTHDISTITEIYDRVIMLKDGKIIGEGKNNVISKNDVTSHAEINALRDASKNTNNYRLNDCSMYVTLEPCHMCAKAAIDARISSIVFAAKEPKTGSIVSIDNFLDKKIFNHNVTYRFGLMEARSSKLLKKFFKLRR